MCQPSTDCWRVYLYYRLSLHFAPKVGQEGPSDNVYRSSLKINFCSFRPLAVRENGCVSVVVLAGWWCRVSVEYACSRYCQSCNCETGRTLPCQSPGLPRPLHSSLPTKLDIAAENLEYNSIVSIGNYPSLNTSVKVAITVRARFQPVVALQCRLWDLNLS